jgi:hypothetical protein
MLPSSLIVEIPLFSRITMSYESVEEKVGTQRETTGLASGRASLTTDYVCACGASFSSEEYRMAHNREVHGIM